MRAVQMHVRPVEAGEVRRWRQVIETAFGEESHDAELAAFMRIAELERLHAIVDGETIVGGGGIFSFRLTVPGGEAPVAAVTAVGVLPTHRRRGGLRALMRTQLDDAHERGEPLAVLWASEGNIYQRFGYGLASLSTSLELARERTAFRTAAPAEGAIRVVTREEAERLFPEVYDRVRVERPGFYARTAGWWETEVFDDPEHRRGGAGRKRFTVHEVDGRAEAYAIHRFHQDWDLRGSRTVLSVRELVAATPRATRELWRFIFDIDLVATIRAGLQPIDHPLLLLLAEPRRMGLTVSDGLWLRVVDVAGALATRSYRGSGSVAFELSDEFCPWNAGVWRLSVADGEGRAERTDGPAELALDAADLGALYLGGFTLADLLRAGRGRELSAGAAERADDLLRTSVAPWCPQVF